MAAFQLTERFWRAVSSSTAGGWVFESANLSVAAESVLDALPVSLTMLPSAARIWAVPGARRTGGSVV